MVEIGNCNICHKSLDLSELEIHLNDNEHLNKKIEIENELTRIDDRKFYTNLSAVAFWVRDR